jgi:putative membrane protein insertion efficiency factor
MKYLLLLLIKIYQKTLSLDHGWLGRVFPNYRVCIYKPSCSEYGYTAIERFGAIKGSWLAFKRFIRCAPWGHPGYDPVPGE